MIKKKARRRGKGDAAWQVQYSAGAASWQKERAGQWPAHQDVIRREEETDDAEPLRDHLAAAAAFLAAVVTSAVAFFTAAVASSEMSLPAASISSTVSI